MVGIVWAVATLAFSLVLAAMRGVPIGAYARDLDAKSATVGVVIVFAAALLFGFGLKFYLDHILPRVPKGRTANIVGYAVAAIFLIWLFTR